ncbi:hypothetical protein ACRFV7_005225 [Klebsiella oxytoca]|uniref:Uncharacterized protein n=11 Tax=Klebsiella/Raoultella group TaxID=2890311 RepID=A0A7H0EVW3_KLEVA|nr:MULTISPECIES: hypothetical protein [Enterobacteriaceae]MBS6125007.1 hypothetical protein [Veillonella sp.]ARD69273.1 Hypothetical protein [Raoultella ornithinolytica]ASG36952.1 hypothetical protein CES89_26420 [Klebsiella pneumoniae]ASI57030.1 hypothetical protein CA210_01815 [Raoultella ornithinolytica]AUH88231.1 hypothetical protein CYE04_27145 [Klebsiella pneumoniae]
MNIYMDGKNVGWLLYLAMGFVALGIAFLLSHKITSMLKIKSTANGGLIISGITLILAGFVMFIVVNRSSLSLDDIKMGERWLNECQLLETNINNGLFDEPTNKVNCNGVIENIPKYSYDDYTTEWLLYHQRNENLKHAGLTSKLSS